MNHIKKKHKEVFVQFEKRKEEKSKEEESIKKDSPVSLKQLTLKQSCDRVRSWDINDDRAQLVDRCIMEMIAVDSQPFSDIGFIQLISTLEPRYTLRSRQYMTSKILPEIHQNVAKSIKHILITGQFYSFTTDVWTADNGVASLLSFTAHWITESFERKCAVLNVLPLEESHTGEYLASKYTEMLSAWEIPIERVHLVLRDNAASVEKAMRDALLPSFGCFAHTLQLVVEEGVIAQRAVTDILTTCRKVVGHFKHSATAYNHFHEIQKRLGIATHKILRPDGIHRITCCSQF